MNHIQNINVPDAAILQWAFYICYFGDNTRITNSFTYLSPYDQTCHCYVLCAPSYLQIIGIGHFRVGQVLKFTNARLCRRLYCSTHSLASSSVGSEPYRKMSICSSSSRVTYKHVERYVIRNTTSVSLGLSHALIHCDPSVPAMLY